MKSLQSTTKLLKKISRIVKLDKKAHVTCEYLASSPSGVVEIESETTVRLEEGRVEAMIDGQWHRVSNRLWAWTPYSKIRQQCKKCGFHDDCRHNFYDRDSLSLPERSERRREYQCMIWTPKLLDAHTLKHMQDPPGALTISPRTPERRDSATLAAQLPQELFECIYTWADCELARTCRAVCRHWEAQCRSAAFRLIDLRKSEAKLLDLVRKLKHDPAWEHIPPLVKEVGDLPWYSLDSKAPWIHLLDSRWKLPALGIIGPFPGRHTIRSIHFDLPRSPPSSLSRGITHVCLFRVHFRRFDDTTCLASELPDLKQLHLSRVTWESLPTELPRRRPRTDRNCLKKVTFEACKVTGVESPSLASVLLALFLGVYSQSSFFPSAILPATQMLAHIVSPFPTSVSVTVRSVSQGRLNHLAIGCAIVPLSGQSFIIIQPSEDSQGGITFLVFIDFDYLDNKPRCWTLLDSAIAALPQSWHPQILLSVGCREDMRAFANHIAELTSLSSRAEVRYTILEGKNGGIKGPRWYGTKLDSEEQRDREIDDLLDVDPGVMWDAKSYVNIGS